VPGGRIEILVEPDIKGFPAKLESGLRSSTGVATKVGSGIATALGVGLLGAGAAFSKIISLTTEFQGNLNSLQAVTGATGDQMAKVSARATELGNDISLPGTSAATAAAAMLELAKGGLTVEQAMAAAKGTLTLAAAAQIDGARAAQIQSDALNQFGLQADQAGHVADLLANSANASAVEITDVAESMKFVGPVAHAMGISIEDATTAIGLLGNAGIRGSEAGTSLRGMLASLAAPSKLAAGALDDLGVKAYDSQGKFVGFPAVIDQLRVAQGKQTDAQFQSNVATAFGRETMSGVLALVNAAPGSWDKMEAAVTKSGGAQEVAAAKMKGLGGAIEGLKSQLETTAITIGTALAPSLESLVRNATSVVGALTDAGSGVGDLTGKFPGLNDLLGRGRQLWEDFRLVLVNAKGAADPVIDALERVSKAASDKGGALSALATGLDHVGNAAVGASQLIGPVGEVLGVVVRVAGLLPGPVQAAALAFLAFKTVPGILSNLRSETDNTTRSTGLLGRSMSTATGPISGAKNALGQFRGEMALQRGLAEASGESIGRLGAAQAAFETSTLKSVSALRSFRDDMRSIQAGAEGAGQPISRLSASFQALEQRSPALSAMAQSFRTVSGAVRDLAPAVEEGVGGRFTTAIEKGRDGLNRFASVAAGAGASIGTGLLKGAGSLISFLGGPWGIALAGAGLALDLLGARQEHAAQAAQQHQQKVDGLRGSLDSLSGSATDATRSMVAQDLTQTKLADGTTTLGTALARAGISATDFVDATTGNQAKLDQLNATLFTQAKATLQNSDAWRNNSQEFAKAGVTLDLATAAALGNVQAQDEMQRKLDANGQGWDGLTDKVKNAIGPLGEIGAQLGAQAGAFAEATAGQKAAGAAAQNFNDVLKTLAENKAFEVLKNGGQITEPMRAGFEALGASAGRMATDAGKAAQGISGIEGGALKARDSMQASRDSFIQAATAAGITAEAANKLADQYGLIPAVAETTYRLNAGDAAGQLQQIADQIKATPDAKTVTVKALSADAIAQLDALGIKVTTLPDGQVQVNVEDAAARAKFDALMVTLNAAKAAPTLDLNTATAQQKADAMKSYIDGLVGVAKADADAAPGTQKADQLKAHIDGITGIMKADADTRPGTKSGDELQRHIDGLVGIMTADANNKPGTAKGDALRAYINKLIGMMTADANTKPGTAESNALKSYIDRLKAAVGVNVNDNEARARLAALTQTRTMTLEVIIRQRALPPGHTAAAGGIVSAMRDGGVVGMAGGALAAQKLTPLRGGIAHIVKPNTWRVIGDRIVDDEAYIPINRSQRSQRIFEETARRMGYSVARMYADGGLAAQRATSSIVAAARVSLAGGSSAAVVAQLAALRAEIAAVRSVTYAPTINNPRAETPAASTAAALRTAAAMARL
jgi:TP901 family phage tail tape measure protein